MAKTKGEKRQDYFAMLLMSHGWQVSPRSGEVLVHPAKPYRIRLTNVALRKEHRVVDRWVSTDSRVHYLKDISENMNGLMWNDRVLVAWSNCL